MLKDFPMPEKAPLSFFFLGTVLWILAVHPYVEALDKIVELLFLALALVLALTYYKGLSPQVLYSTCLMSLCKFIFSCLNLKLVTKASISIHKSFSILYLTSKMIK